MKPFSLVSRDSLVGRSVRLMPYESRLPRSGKFGAAAALCEAPQQYPDRIRSISSATYLSAAAPPTLIIEPVEDGFIPSEAVFAFAAKARAAGVDMTLVRIPTTNHFPVYADSPAGQANRTITFAYLRDLLGQS